MRLTRTITTVPTAIALALAGLSAAFAQATPDLSGRWTVYAEDPLIAPPPPPAPPQPPDGRPLPPPPPPPPQTLELTISQTPSEVRVDRLVASRDGQFVYNFVYRLDGTETTNQMGPVVSRSTAAWEGPKLVITSVLLVGSKELGNAKEVYSLDGAQLIVEYSRTTPVMTMTGRTTYTREGRP